MLQPSKALQVVIRRFAESVTADKALIKSDQKLYGFDLKYAVRRFDPNFDNLKPLVTIENKQSRFKEPVIVFPGFEGRLDNVEPLVKNLNRTVHCLQYPFEKSKNSIVDIAASVREVLRSRALDEGRINMIGHSYGGIIAVELIKRLEEEGKEVRLCLTDSSPYAIKMMLLESFGNPQQCDEFENNLIMNISNGVEFEDLKMLEDILSTCVDWQEKQDAVFSVVAQKTNSNVEHLKIVASSLHRLIQAIHDYNENDIKLDTETVLIRSSKKVLPFPEDFKISKLFNKPVKEFRTEGHHMNMLKFPLTANLINDALKE